MSASRQLPARPNLEHLRNEAKQRLTALRQLDSSAQLADAQRELAREYGFASWGQLKAAVDRAERERVVAAARDGDVDTVRRALDRGFHPGTIDDVGRTLHQVAKTLRHTAVELLLREHQERDDRPDDYGDNASALHFAAQYAGLEVIRMLVDAGADVIGAGDDHQVGVLGWATC